jgi:hypothetical protein
MSPHWHSPLRDPARSRVSPSRPVGCATGWQYKRSDDFLADPPRVRCDGRVYTPRTHGAQSLNCCKWPQHPAGDRRHLPCRLQSALSVSICLHSEEIGARACAMARRWHAGPKAHPCRRNRPDAGPGLCCWFGVEPPPKSNRRPHPYHGSTGNRCAEPRFPRSRPTVGAKVIGSRWAKLCVLGRLQG